MISNLIQSRTILPGVLADIVDSGRGIITADPTTNESDKVIGEADDATIGSWL